MALILEKTKSQWIIKPNVLREGKDSVIVWSTFLLANTGESGLRATFLASIRELVTAYIDSSQQKWGELNPDTLKNWAGRLRIFTRWMTSNNIWEFSKLSKSDLLNFIETTLTSSKGQIQTGKTIQAYIHMLKLMWEIRNSYSCALKVNPHTISEFVEIVNAGESLIAWHPLPINDALLLIKEAITYLENVTPSLLLCLTQLKKLSFNYVGITKHQRKKLIQKRYGQLAKSEEYAELVRNLDTKNLNVGANLRLAIRSNVGAVAIVILFLTGIRVSELLSLKHTCVKHKTHSNDKNYYYIEGISAKKRCAPKQWIAPDPVIEAISLLKKINSLMYTNSSEYLFITFLGNGALPAPWTRVTRLNSSPVITTIIRDFAVKAKKLARPAYESFHPHQARKNFASFVALRDKRSLHALAQHYGHVYYGMTDRSYVGTDIKLHEILNIESRNDLASGLMDLIESRNVGGKAGKSIEEFRASSQRFKGKRAIKQLVDKLIEDGVVLAPCDWGYCLYSQDMSACKGSLDGPNPINRSPDICSGCSNFAVTETHRSWWEDRYEKQVQFLDNKNLSEQAVTIANNRAAGSLVVLNQLNMKVTNPS